LRVAIIIERADITLGGAERSIFELASALSAVGLDVDILAAKGQPQAQNITVLCANTHGKRTPYSAFAKALRQHLSRNRYDIIHSALPFDFADVYQPRGGTYPESIRRNAASYQDKLIELYKRATAFANIRRAGLFRAERRICRSAEGPIVAALSEYVRRQFADHYRLPADRLVVIPNGIRIDKQPDQKRADVLRAQILAKLGLTEADKAVLLLFAANNFRLKGLACLINALHITVLNNRCDNLYLVVAGRDKSTQYRRLARKLRIHDRVVFLGKVRHVRDTLSITDVAALPTFYDPCSRFIFEALAAGKPVITTKFNGATDLFADDRHGKVIDRPENLAQLAKAITYFADAENIKKASQAIAQDNLKDKISIARVARQLSRLYDDLLKKRRNI